MKVHQIARAIPAARSAITMDQVFAAERLDSTGFDRVLAAVNKGDVSTAMLAYAAIEAKVAAGYILTPMTRELFERADEVLKQSVLH